MSLKTDYKDAQLDTAHNTTRVYDIVDENDNVIQQNIHLVDRTVYQQAGDNFGASDINETNEAINENASTLAEMEEISTFTVAVSAWTTNADASTKDAYPKIATIATDKYADDSTPLWDVVSSTSASGVPTSAEFDSINMVSRAYFASAGITLYATDTPTTAMKLRVKGV